MSQTEFLKCPCRQCGGPIEFPPQGVGLTIDCPHCGQKTLLGRAGSPTASAPEATPAPDLVAAGTEESRRSMVIPLLVMLLAAGAGWWWYQRGTHSETSSNKAPTLSNKLAALASPDPKLPSPPPPQPPPSAEPIQEPAAPSQPKSPDDLKPGPVALEKAKSGSLVHAVGTLKNDSDHQRFGVRVEIGLTDAKGQALRSATDYTAVIEPRKEWRFRALVLDAKATAGKVVSIKEDH